MQKQLNRPCCSILLCLLLVSFLWICVSLSFVCFAIQAVPCPSFIWTDEQWGQSDVFMNTLSTLSFVLSLFMFITVNNNQNNNKQTKTNKTNPTISFSYIHRDGTSNKINQTYVCFFLCVLFLFLMCNSGLSFLLNANKLIYSCLIYVSLLFPLYYFLRLLLPMVHHHVWVVKIIVN